MSLITREANPLNFGPHGPAVVGEKFFSLHTTLQNRAGQPLSGKNHVFRSGAICIFIACFGLYVGICCSMLIKDRIVSGGICRLHAITILAGTPHARMNNNTKYRACDT